ncbi:aspartate/glutamate racemase family protein [Variovorax sp. RA8]|uniref:aspartate/glutamate racemase family protein n=1 Tax=Variovorax sp. (strain JCM 16519 / RA8) TaxID=662548 RepID=UPI000A53D7E7|nr:aspartate/glutamate racemase family protein [Variovorax sp. RA8]VTU38609.1 Hydantoin racemase [Variovorax sp. RA8]
MKTLFLNPNSSEEITATLRRHIGRCGWPADRWEVAKVDDAPRIIGTASQNAEAEAALERALPALSNGFDRVVMMSSVDTGYDVAHRLFGDEAYGFTRSVLAQHRRLGQQLQIVTFDKAMTALYASTVEATGHRAVVAGWTVVDRLPAAVAAQPSLALEELRTVCRDLARTSMHPIFVVGAVGLALTDELRKDGMTGLVDPVADLLGWLGSA